jgi:hypothetical protein
MDNGFDLDIKNPRGKDKLAHLPPGQLSKSISSKERRAAELMEHIGLSLEQPIKTNARLTALSEIARLVTRPTKVVAGTKYRTIGVKWWGEGAYERETIDGAETAAKTLSIVREGDLIINKIWVRHGSTAVATSAVDGCAASGEFPTFELDAAKVLGRWIHWQTKTRAFWKKCSDLSRGTSGKNRIKPELFLTIQIHCQNWTNRNGLLQSSKSSTKPNVCTWESRQKWMLFCHQYSTEPRMEVSSMYSLTDWKTRFPRIPQRGPFWCIPASIENMLRYAGLSVLSQEDLILGYCRKFGQDALLNIVSTAPLQALPASIQGLSDVQILRLAKRCAFRHGNFETFADPARQNVAFQNAKLSLDFIGSIKTKGDYCAAMTEAVKGDCPVLISVDNGNRTFHIQAVVEIHADKFTAYDPALNRLEQYNLANCVFSNDVLVLKRLP